jgi:hypothetical protein
MGSAGRSRSTASGSRRHKVQKQAVRGKFETRHIDLVFSDIVKDAKDVHDECHGPMGNVSKCANLSCAAHASLRESRPTLSPLRSLGIWGRSQVRPAFLSWMHIR